VTGLLGVGLVVFVLVWFQPQKLFLDQTVNEALPGTILLPRAAGTVAAVPIASPITTLPASPPAARPPARPPARLTVLASGRFRSLEHGTSGTALILRRGDRSLFLRFEDLDTSNGPMLHVYLSEVPAGNQWHAYGIRFVDLGPLKGNVGNQNYELPGGIELSRYRSAVIWCNRFKVGFGVAALRQLASL